MKNISIQLPEALITGLNKLVKLKLYGSRSEAVRSAVRDLLRREEDKLVAAKAQSAAIRAS